MKKENDGKAEIIDHDKENTRCEILTREEADTSNTHKECMER